MTDLSLFVQRCSGMLRTPVRTMQEHADPLPPWRVVMREHVIPLIIASAAVSTLLFWLIPPPILVRADITFGPLELLIQFALTAVFGIASVFVTGAVVAVFSGMFGGIQGFNGGMVLAGLAMTPHYLAEALRPLPAIGLLLAIAGLIASLVLLYRGAPVVLRVPAQNHGKHFALTFLTLLLMAMVAGALMGPIIAPALVGQAG